MSYPPKRESEHLKVRREFVWMNTCDFGAGVSHNKLPNTVNNLSWVQLNPSKESESEICRIDI